MNWNLLWLIKCDISIWKTKLYCCLFKKKKKKVVYDKIKIVNHLVFGYNVKIMLVHIGLELIRDVLFNT
jgi:hypothetical protein